MRVSPHQSQGQHDITQSAIRQIVLASRPRGLPQSENFRLEEAAMPETPPGGVLLRDLFLSLDPYMRGRMTRSFSGPYHAPAAFIGMLEGRNFGKTLVRVAT
jgi:NADPH-dependent curcumin reductase CurA